MSTAMTDPIPDDLQAYEFTYRNTPRGRKHTAVRFGVTAPRALAGMWCTLMVDSYRHLGTAQEYTDAQAVSA